MTLNADFTNKFLSSSIPISINAGAKMFLNSSIHIHRDDGPAWDSPNGLKLWRNNGDKRWPTF